MLQITLTAAQPADPDDALGRTRVGYAPDMSPAELFDAARGDWAIGKAAGEEHFALFCFNGVGVLAARITDVVEHPTKPRRRIIEGEPLAAGHPVHDAFVGQPAPGGQPRNPAIYLDLDVATLPCQCGCGRRVHRRDFVSGHDHKAVHRRISQIGTIPEFMAWFDALPAHMQRGGTVPEAETTDDQPLSPAVVGAVQAEVAHAIAKHGIERGPGSATLTDEAKLAILTEEIGEVAHALTYDGPRQELRDELIQVSAMAALWVQSLGAR